MCGIGGFSLTPGSKINPRKLANSLLSALEDRGYMASGFAWHSPDGHGVYKSDKPGSQLSLKSLPKSAKTVIVHTRLATHGAVTDNRNNHPVMSPSEDIALVHNGVIYNHYEVRSKIPSKLPDVDTSVIPALIEDANLDRLTELDGDAAIAWLSASDLGTLNVARLQHSPLVIAQVEDGSFIFASTEALLWRVLIALDLQPEFMQTVDEYKYMRVRDGIMLDFQDLPKPEFDDYDYDYSYYRHQTAGAKGTPKPYNYDFNPYGSSAYAQSGVWYDDEWADYDDDEYFAQYWREHGVSPADVARDLAQEEDDTPPPVPSDDASFWIEYRAKSFHDRTHYMWYRNDELDAYRTDVWLLRNDHETDYVLIDHGSVTPSGVLVSAVDR